MPIDKKPPVARTVKGLRVPTLKLPADSQVSRTVNPKPALSETGWIGAIDALYLLAPHFGEEENAKAELMLRLSRGDLTCRAACWCQEADRGKVDKHDIDWSGYIPSRPHDGQREPTILEEPKEEEGRVSVPMDIFLTANGWTINTGETDWKLGYFIGRKSVELLTEATVAPANNNFIRRFAFGLEFHLSEIAALMPSRASLSLGQSEEEPVESDAAKRSNAGRNPADAWYDWIAEAIVHFNLDGVDTAISADDFYDLMARKMNDRKQKSPKKESVEKALRSIKNRWREAKANGEIQD